MRVDATLVRDGLARSRRHAVELIEAGRVTLDGVLVRRPAAPAGPGTALRVTGVELDDGYASRGAYKLVGALDAFGIDPSGLDCLDAGASTGGFTDVLLRRGARRVIAVDVGHDQMVARLREDPRVEVREGVNVRELAPGDVDPAPALVVADLSFISLTLVLPALAAVVAPAAELVVMVKPQFEVGRERLGSGGVVRSPRLRAEAVVSVGRCAGVAGLGVLGVVASPLPGPSGNVEFFLRLRAGATPAEGWEQRVDEVVRAAGDIEGGIAGGRAEPMSRAEPRSPVEPRPPVEPVSWVGAAPGAGTASRVHGVSRVEGVSGRGGVLRAGVSPRLGGVTEAGVVGAGRAGGAA